MKAGNLFMIEGKAVSRPDRWPLLRLMSQHELVYRPEHTRLAKKNRFRLTVVRHFVQHLGHQHTARRKGDSGCGLNTSSGRSGE